MSSCATCGQDTITDAHGRDLHPRKSIVGRYLPDGTEITPDDLRQGVRAHVLHTCPPAALRPLANTEQQQLF